MANTPASTQNQPERGPLPDRGPGRPRRDPPPPDMPAGSGTARSNQKQELPTTGQTTKALGIAFYRAVVQATEEAVANALIPNEDMTGRDGHRSPALPRRRLAEILSRTRAA